MLVICAVVSSVAMALTGHMAMKKGVTVLVAGLWLELVINVCVALFTTQLGLYHAWLVSKGVSTYDHIMHKQEKRLKEIEFKVSKRF